MVVENTNKGHSSEELFQRTEIEGTPFELITISKTGKRFVAWGKNRLTNMLSEREAAEVVKDLESVKVSWDILGAMMSAIAIGVLNVGNEMVEQTQEEEI